MKRLLNWFLGIPHLFSKMVVAWCVYWGTHFSGKALDVMERTGMDTGTTLGVILVFFGGELALLFGRDALKGTKNKSEKKDVES